MPFSSGRGRLSEPWPLMFATNSVLPSAERTIAPGYQPVGISPARRLVLGRSLPISPSDDLSAKRTTATQLLLPLATYSVSPFGLRARALQPLPNGKRCSGRQLIVSTTSSFFVSMTDTVSLLALAT